MTDIVIDQASMRVGYNRQSPYMMLQFPGDADRIVLPIARSEAFALIEMLLWALKQHEEVDISAETPPSIWARKTTGEA